MAQSFKRKLSKDVGATLTKIGSYDTSLIGKKYENGVFVEVPVVVPEVWLITKFAFKKRFPAAKWRNARSLISLDAQLADFFEDIDFAKFIDLKFPDLIAGVNFLGTTNVPADIQLTQEEINAILNTPCQVGEEV